MSELKNNPQPEVSQESGSYDSQGTIYYSLETTTRKTQLGRQIVERCVTYGIIAPVNQLESQVKPGEEGPFYSEADLMRLRRVRRLINDLGLNWAGVELVMRLTEELEQVRNELLRLQSGR